MAHRFPRRFGGRDRTLEIEHKALLDELAPGWDVSEDTEVWIETHAEALAVTMIWAINRRAGNQMIPARMLENVRVWEEVLALRPIPTDTDRARRERIAGKLRGIAGNTLGDMADVAAKIFGANFDGVRIAENPYVYWPGVNPGPPGFEYSSNRATVCFVLTKSNMDDVTFATKRAELIEQLEAMRAAWLTYVIGVGDGCVCDEAICDETLLGE